MASVSNQAYVFLCTVIGGIAIAFLYDLFRIFRKAVKPGNAATFFQDLLYWLIVALIMFLTVYYSNDGELRGYLFIGALVGVILYALLLSRIIMDSALFIIKIIGKIFKAIVYIVSYPIRMTVKVLKAPVGKLSRAAGKALRKAGCRSRVKLTKLKFIKKGLSNIWRKV